jgi:hypothetical protein
MTTPLAAPASLARDGATTSRIAILVLGMHRSGTSALTGTLIRLGLQGPATLMVPLEANPLGYWESRPFCDFHDHLLDAGGTTWDQQWTPFQPDRIGAEEVATAQRVAELRTQGEAHSAELKFLAREFELARARVDDVLASASWRLTAPLRRVKEASTRADIIQ